MKNSKIITVLQVLESLGIGGMERVTVNLALRKGQEGFRCGLAALVEGGGLEEEVRSAGVPLTIIHKEKRFDWRAVRRLAAEVDRLGADVIHAHNTLGMLYSIMAGRLTRTPVITTLHGSSFQMPVRHRRLRRWMSSQCRNIVCVSSSAYNAARMQDRIPEHRLRLIYNGISLAKPDAQSAASKGLREELHLNQRGGLFISVGRLSAEKDLPTMIRAMALLPAKGARAHLAIAGDGPERIPLQEFVLSQGQGEHITILGSRMDVPALLASADVFIQSSLTEGTSIAILEAMAAGLPVAATAVGGNVEVVVPEETGLLVPPSDPSALAGAMSALLDNPGRCRALGEAGARRVAQHFSLEAMAGAYALLYREALGLG
ncbi:MAG: glycosyltransferase [Proteobacteria bacterium]|nr:glycosyltransferase [Pseudomonadota bacterium]MBU1451115.1 glycosyltransferase [Pseudomonadota bacterium]MBU2469133.1 glycosyltransferase [Pseudomonadota bacterium]MBU2517836.1 glycosyltransferase [Pseudomonadota bacterium]